MAVNSEQTLDGLRWSGWGNPSTTGRGDVETLICDPTCAQAARALDGRDRPVEAAALRRQPLLHALDA